MKLLLSTLLFAAFSANATAACSSDMHKAFDFWAGEWTVHDAKGTLAGTNSIRKIQGECVLQENWTSAASSLTGVSLNFYNSEKKQWQQLWLDSSGGKLELKGNRIDNQMIMRTDDATNKQGKPYYHKITWTKNEDGTVRQVWETISDKQTSIAFDGLYTKTKIE